MTREEYKVPRNLRARYEAVTTITDEFCQQYLNEGYAELCRNMAASLSRKRPSPLERGRSTSWAAGIVYALAQVNFLFDKSEEPYLSATDLCARIGVSQGTASGKAKEIRDRLKIRQLDPAWCLPELIERNPLVWLIQVNGMIMDARRLPRAIQEEAYRLGLIPYVP